MHEIKKRRFFPREKKKRLSENILTITYKNVNILDTFYSTVTDLAKLRG